MKQRRLVAVHEAAHCVLAKVCGLPLHSCSIRRGRGRLGRSLICIFPREIVAIWEEHGRQRRERTANIGIALTVLAGTVATEEFLLDHGSGDVADMHLLADTIAGRSVPFDENDSAVHLQWRLRQFTRRLVHRHRDRIERISEALLKEVVLSAERIEALI